MNRRGFTIVELLIVIVVIAILASITIVAYNGIQQRARDTKRINDLAAIDKAFKLYNAETGNDFSVFSAGSGGAEQGWFDVPYTTYSSVKTVLETTGYLNGNIVDPKNVKEGSGSSGNYAYMMARCTASDESTRLVLAHLENTPSQTIAQQINPLACDAAEYTSYTNSAAAGGYGMNYARVVTLK